MFGRARLPIFFLEFAAPSVDLATTLAGGALMKAIPGAISGGSTTNTFGQKANRQRMAACMATFGLIPRSVDYS